MKEVADGFIILKRYGSFKNACWILYHNGEGAIVETPNVKKNEKPPWKKSRKFFQKTGIFPKYVLLSHVHWDHCNSLPDFHREFPESDFVGHRSFLENPFIKYMSRIQAKSGYIRNYIFFDEIFDGDYWEGELGGEPLYLIYAPKHSYEDVMIIFRGAMITGDWYIGDLKDCNNLVNPEHKIQSIEKLQWIVHRLNYNVHMLFSAHGDCLFYNADFYKIMEKCKISHKTKKIKIPATFVQESELKSFKI